LEAKRQRREGEEGLHAYDMTYITFQSRRSRPPSAEAPRGASQVTLFLIREFDLTRHPLVFTAETQMS
jgi:hypothetical protein